MKFASLALGLVVISSAYASANTNSACDFSNLRNQTMLMGLERMIDLNNPHNLANIAGEHWIRNQSVFSLIANSNSSSQEVSNHQLEMRTMSEKVNYLAQCVDRELALIDRSQSSFPGIKFIRSDEGAAVPYLIFRSENDRSALVLTEKSRYLYLIDKNRVYFSDDNAFKWNDIDSRSARGISEIINKHIRDLK